jgi:hypothetical protein
VSELRNFSENGILFGNPQCVNSGEFVGDHYCEEGSWTSRTKFLAQEMLEVIAPREFSLFCDSYQNVFNYYKGTLNGKKMADYVQGAGQCEITVSTLHPIPCMNNFCVLETPDGISFGTTLNKELDTPEMSLKDFFEIEDITFCDVPGSGLKRCFASKVGDRQSFWYYDKDNKILVNSEFTLNTRSDLFTRMIRALKDWLLGESTTGLQFSYEDLQSGLDLEYLDQDQRYDRLFFMKEKGKSVVAINGIVRDFQAQKPFNYVGVQYLNFGFKEGDVKRRDVCSYVDIYGAKQSSDYDLYCSKERVSGTPYYVFATSPNQVDIWKDLTSKLRLI